MSKKVKFHSLTGRITLPLMHKAFRAVKRNRGAPGIDKVSVQMFENQLEQNLDALMRELKSGEYRPLPLRRLYIPKGPGSTKLRPLGIPVVRDRVAQEVVRLLLAPIFEPQFHPASFGFIPNRNCHQALERVLELHRQGYTVVLDADIQGFFDNLSHKIIMDAVREEVADGNILNLVERFLTAGVVEEGDFRSTLIGTPQGGVISPLLANIVLNKLDWKLEAAGYRFARYADDFVVLCQTHEQAQLNRVIRGTANYFATAFSTSRWTFQKLDSWIRMRVRAMKYKRKNYGDNRKLGVKFFRHKLGLLSLEQFCTERDSQGKVRYVLPRHGATSFGVAR